MRFGWSLQTRFMLATSVLVLVLCGVFAAAVHLSIDLLEDELLNHTLAREMQEFKADVAANPEARPPSTTDMTGFLVRGPRDQLAVPQELAALSPGLHEDISWRGRNYMVAIDSVKDTRLYLALDTEHVEAIETAVASVAALIGLVAIAIAAVVGLALSRAVMRPVTALATEVEQLDPSRRGERLTNRFANREVAIIATAFDNYVDRLDRVLEREQAFTEDASHELRTPLAIISSAAELLTDEPELSTAARERVQRIRRATAQMQSLIEALLFLARGEVAVGTVTQLDQIVRESVELIASSAAAKSLRIETEVESVPVNGSPVMAACVVNNLLVNAVNYTQQGTISVRLRPGELVVEDTGIGIPPEDLSRIFERRYRGPQSRGLGLGLYLVSRICQRLSWKIEALSSPGRGTTFRIELPVVAVSTSAPAEVVT